MFFLFLKKITYLKENYSSTNINNNYIKPSKPVFTNPLALLLLLKCHVCNRESKNQ